MPPSGNITTDKIPKNSVPLPPPPPPRFVFHKLHQPDFAASHNTIQKQNSFLTNHHVIPITGISDSMMFSLEQYLHQLDGIIKCPQT